jgi:hypothetical protein
MVGRVIGKNGETIKALQTYTGALIQIDQTVEPTKVTISGTPHSLSLAVSMVTDIVKGTFKGFALLRQVTNAGVRPAGAPAPAPAPAPMAQPRPVYAPGYGLIPPSQVRAGPRREGGAGIGAQRSRPAVCGCGRGGCRRAAPQSAHASPTARLRPTLHTPTHPLISAAPQLYGADDRTAGVVAVGRQPGAVAWPAGGQVVPSQVILVRSGRGGGGGGAFGAGHAVESGRVGCQQQARPQHAAAGGGGEDWPSRAQQKPASERTLP